MTAKAYKDEEIAALLIGDSSRAAADYGASLVMAKPSLLKPLMQCMKEAKGSIPMRAANIVDKVAMQETSGLLPYLGELIGILLNTPHHGVRRCLLKVMSEHYALMDEEQEGLLTDRSFGWIVDPKQKVAVKVYAMDILIQAAKRYPDLIPEVTTLVQEQSKKESAAFAARAYKDLKILNKG